MSQYKSEANGQLLNTMMFLRGIHMPFTFKQAKAITLHRLEAECAAKPFTQRDYLKEIIAAVKRL